jgi:hypothetical protein
MPDDTTDDTLDNSLIPPSEEGISDKGKERKYMESMLADLNL